MYSSLLYIVQWFSTTPPTMTHSGAGGKAEHGGSVEGGEITAHQVQAGGEDDQACWGGGGGDFHGLVWKRISRFHLT